MRYIISIILILIIAFGINSCKKDPAANTGVHIDVVAQNLTIPWGMGFLPNGDFIFCERNGNLNTIKQGETAVQTLLRRTIIPQGEGGLLGLAIDPQFSSNNYIYIYETANSSNRVVRLRYIGGTVTEDAIIVANIPYATYHDGGGLAFGPDGYLYIGTGDTGNGANSQDLNTLAGKILRVDRDGNAAPGNPFSSRIWSYGHRNVQGFAWNPQGEMIATEHGPSGENGWRAHDEINHIIAGRNYGWPLVYGDMQSDTLEEPIYQSGDDTWAPSGIAYIQGSQWGAWQNTFVVGALKGERLIRFGVNANGTANGMMSDTLKGEYRRLRNVTQAPDGSIYFCSSNLTNSPLSNDDKIYRMYVE